MWLLLIVRIRFLILVLPTLLLELITFALGSPDLSCPRRGHCGIMPSELAAAVQAIDRWRISDRYVRTAR